MPELFNVREFGPPGPFTAHSTWPWVDHLVSGLLPATNSPYLRLAFATAPHLKCLALPQTITRRFIMQKVRRHPLPVRRRIIGLRPLVGVWFQVLLTPLIGVLFIVQSPYFPLSVVEEYLALEGGPPSFTRSFTSPVLLWNVNAVASVFAYGTITLYGRTFQTVPLTVATGDVDARNPGSKPRFGLFRFRSPLLTESRLISFPAGTEMFQFPAFAPYGLYIQPQVPPSGCPVTVSFPIRKSRDQRLFDSCPRLIAVCHVLHRLSTPRHPPYTLSSLTISIDD